MTTWIPNGAAAFTALTTLVLACNSSDAPRGALAQQQAAPETTPEINAEPLVPASRVEPRIEALGADPLDDQDAPARTPDVIYVPTPQPVVDKMLQIAQVKKSDVVYDLGCGDGRIVVTAAKRYGVRAYGFDIDPARVAEARENVEKNGVSDLVTIEQADIFELDLSPANVVTLYLLPELNVRLIPQLEELRPGSRVVSHDFDMRGVKPALALSIQPEGTERRHQIFLFKIPLEKVTSEEE